MAVSSQTAADPDQTGRTPNLGQSPIRTCIGCRTRAAAAELLRVVAGPGSNVHPDPRRRAAGRGAWVHPDPGCVDLAERRRAYGRALRVPGPLDLTALREYVMSRPDDLTGGTPQE
ncbi:MAG TPA: YlxR family protein [Jatrophihabitantaceae bacterium]|nr:YlxR family protein [Jatrophihabitantaceae bacterium]